MDAQLGDLDEPYQQVSVEDARRMIERGGVQIVDIRRPGEYAAGHLSGSMSIPLDRLFDRSDELSFDQDIIFVCAIGVKSEYAAEIAASLGRTRVYNLRGGIATWLERGYPVQVM